MTHRQDAVYPATIVGIPPMENFYIGVVARLRDRCNVRKTRDVETFGRAFQCAR